MDRSPLPHEKLIRETFGGTECLYRNHRGHRVILDTDGDGYFDVSGPNLRVEIDGRTHDLLRGPFQGSLVVTTPDEGIATGLAYLGRDAAPDLGIPNAPATNVEGRGWVLTAETPLEVDGLPGIAPAPGFPLPFFRSVAADQPFRAIVTGDPAVLVDRFSVDDLEGLKRRLWKVQNISAIHDLSTNGRTAPVASHLNRASWRVAIPADSRGLRLRKTYDRFHGRQRARVLIDGVFAGWWYEPSQDRERRWGVSEFGIRDVFAKGKGEIEITIDPPGGAPLWSFSSYELYSL